MSTLTFDTLKFANRLKTAGVPAVQAEAEAEALSEVFETNLSELVTNKDMDAKFEKTTSLLRHEIRTPQMDHGHRDRTDWLNNRHTEVLPD